MICHEERIDHPFFSRYIRYKQSLRTRHDLYYHNYPVCVRCLKGAGVFFVEDRPDPFAVGMHRIAQSSVERSSLWESIWLDDADLGLKLPLARSSSLIGTSMSFSA